MLVGYILAGASVGFERKNIRARAGAKVEGGFVRASVRGHGG